jgi:hypothetical protein
MSVLLLINFRVDFLPQLYGVTKTENSLSIILHGWHSYSRLQGSRLFIHSEITGDKSRATVAQYYASLSTLEQVIFEIIYVSGSTTF